MRWRKLIKDNQKNFSRLHMLIDVFVIAASYALAWLIRFQGIFEHSAVQSKTVQEYMFMLIFIIPGYLLLYQAFDLYTPMRMQGRRLVLAGIVKANALGLLIIMFALYNFKELDYSRLTLVSFCVINIVLEWFVRMVIFYILRDMRKKGMNQKQVLLVGYSRAAEEYVDRILQNPQWGYVIRGILDDNVPAGTTYKGVKVIGRIANLMIILPSSRLDEIAITLGLSEYYRLEEIVALCEKSGVHTKFIPDYNNIIPTKPYTEDILGLPVINIRYVPLSNTFNAASFTSRIPSFIHNHHGNTSDVHLKFNTTKPFLLCFELCFIFRTRQSQSMINLIERRYMLARSKTCHRRRMNTSSTRFLFCQLPQARIFFFGASTLVPFYFFCAIC